MSACVTVFCKELLDAARDRRAIAALFLFPVLGPVLIYFLLHSIIDLGVQPQSITLPVAGAENAPDLMDYLRQSGVDIEPLALEGEFSPAISSAIAEAIAGRDYDFVLVIPRDFGGRIAASRTVNLELHYDSSRAAALPQTGQVANLIQAWSRETAFLRLLVRGISTEVVNPVNLSRIDVANDQARARSILGMIPMFVVMAAFVSGMGLAVDATAGERERKTLEPLLVNPLPRSAIVLGKWLAAALFSAIGLILVMVLNLLVLRLIPLEELGLTVVVGPREILGILVTTLPLAFFATSIQLFLGIFARSFKDAQAYLSLVILLPVIPYFFNIFNTLSREPWMHFVPMLGQHMLLGDVISGVSPSSLDYAIAALTVSAFSLILIHATAKLFERESVIFS